MPIDADAQAFVERIGGGPPMHELGVDVIRALSTEMRTAAGPDVETVEDRTIPSVDGDVSVRVYTPDGAGPFPVLVVMHGGGFVMGSLDSIDGHARKFCYHGGCMVVSVDYRLAPEAKFPVPLEDCYAAVKWVADNADELNADPARIAVAGESSGANLAAGTALVARDRGGPDLVGQVLVVPLLDRSFDAASWKENADYPPPQATMDWFWQQYLSSEEDASNPYAQPLVAEDLSGLPRTLIITAECDPMRDNGEAYAKRLAEAGVDVQAERFDGMIHMFYLLAGILPKGDQAVAMVCSTLKDMFDTSSPA
jgi:acetyl esterase